MSPTPPPGPPATLLEPFRDPASGVQAALSGAASGPS